MDVLRAAGPMFGVGDMLRPAGRMFGPGTFGAAVVLVLIAALIVLVVWLVVRKPKASTAASVDLGGNDSALTIARERLARGEIDANQYFTIVTTIYSATPVIDTASASAQTGPVEPATPAHSTA